MLLGFEQGYGPVRARAFGEMPRLFGVFILCVCSTETQLIATSNVDPRTVFCFVSYACPFQSTARRSIWTANRHEQHNTTLHVMRVFCFVLDFMTTFGNTNFHTLRNNKITYRSLGRVGPWTCCFCTRSIHPRGLDSHPTPPHPTPNAPSLPPSTGGSRSAVLLLPRLGLLLRHDARP